MAAIDVWLDRTAVAGFYIRHARANHEHLHAEFMAGDSRIAEERHLAEIAGDVRAANSYAMDAQQRFARPGLRHVRDVDAAKLFWLFKLDGFHLLNCFSRDLRRARCFLRGEKYP